LPYDKASASSELIRRLIDRSIQAVRPSELFASQFMIDGKTLIAFGEKFDLTKFKHIRCIAIGKSAEAMAYEVEKKLGEKVTGIIATPVQKHFDTSRFRFFKTGHPFPDAESYKAGMETLRLVSDCGKNDLLLFLVSGGGSAATFVPVDGVTFEEAIELMKTLFVNGVPISEINLIRRHLSALGGGRLAALAPDAQKLSLIMSDVVGDELISIASGPTVPDPTSSSEAYNFLVNHGLIDKIPKSIGKVLKNNSQSTIIKRLNTNHLKIIASNKNALDAASRTATENGFKSTILTRFFEMEASEAGKFLVSIAESIEFERRPISAPALVLLGGETTVKTARDVTTSSDKVFGAGGRNQHLVLNALLKMVQLKERGLALERTTIFSFGTDGKDGNSDDAGAFASLRSFEAIRNLKEKICQDLINYNSNSFFKKHGGLLTTGYTDTNVMDIMGVIVE
jgi:glycerate 2-kinase